jgi:hypothetical protein
MVDLGTLNLNKSITLAKKATKHLHFEIRHDQSIKVSITGDQDSHLYFMVRDKVAFPELVIGYFLFFFQVTD